MDSIFDKMKLNYYFGTLLFVVAFHVIEGARPTHYVLDSPLIYGDAGHIVLLFLTFTVSVYLRYKNIYRKWLYPICVAIIIYAIVPYTALLFINQPEVTRYFLNVGWLVFGFIFVFLPHLIVPLLGTGIGCIINRLIKKMLKSSAK